MRRSAFGLAAALSLLLAACGGDDTTEGTEPPVSSDSEAETESETPTTAPKTEPENEEPEGAPAEGVGTANVGDKTWEFTITGEDGRELCMPDMGGLFQVFIFGEDGDGQQTYLIIQAPSSGGDALVETGVGAVEEWMADGNVYEDYGMVEGLVIPEDIGASAQISGNTISGSGVFFEEIAMQAARSTGVYEEGTLEGDFVVTCPTE